MGEYHRIPLRSQGRRLWARKLSRPQIARPCHWCSREVGWELPTETSAHQWHTIWLHAWAQHHRHYIHCATATRKVVCHQQHRTWPLSIWKKHYIVHPDVSSDGPCASSTSRSGCCSSYTACLCMKTPESEFVLVASWVKCSAWKWTFTKALGGGPNCSSRFWKPSPKSFIQRVPRKTCMKIIWSFSHWINRWTAREADPLDDQHGMTGTSGQMGKPMSWYLGRGSNVLQNSGKDPCGVCLKNLSTNPIFCGGWSCWINKKYTGISSTLMPALGSNVVLDSLDH